jgi:hypothetical protein
MGRSETCRRRSEGSWVVKDMQCGLGRLDSGFIALFWSALCIAWLACIGACILAFGLLCLGIESSTCMDGSGSHTSR